MIHASGSGLLDPGLERYIILASKWCLAGESRSAYFWCQSGVLLVRVDPLIFGAKTAPFLWRADPSFGKLFYWIWEYSKVL